MGDWRDDLNEVTQSFYLAPNAQGAVRAFEAWLCTEQPTVVAFHTFTRMAMVSDEVRAGFAGLRHIRPGAVDAVLRGFEEPTFPRVGNGPPTPEEMDLLWVEFFITGKVEPLLRIIGILDEPDLVRAKLTQWLRATGVGSYGRRNVARFVPVLARCMIPVRLESMEIDGPVDVDILVAIAARDRKLKFDELPVALSDAELVRVVAKHAAVWSLKVNARTHAPVARLCELEKAKDGGAGRLLLRPAR